MPLGYNTTTAIILLAAMSGVAFAASHIDEGAKKAMDSRHAHMQLYSFNISTLGAMAQDKAPYDAATAAAAANNIAALASIDQTAYWVAGTDSSVEGSRAKPEIWSDRAGFDSKANDLLLAATTLAGVAGDGIDALKGAFGPVGGSCGACHETFRVPRS